MSQDAMDLRADHAPPDPVAEAKAYQDHLLAALGDDDPAVVQAATGEQLRAVIADAGADLRTRPAEGEWSVLEARVGIHRERGPESLDLSFRIVAGHGRVHLAQARRTLEVVRSRSEVAAG